MSESFFSYRNFALLIWDVQYGITFRTIKLQESLQNIQLLIEAARARKAPIIYSQSTGLPFELQSAYSRFWIAKRGIDPQIPRMQEGTHDWEILPEVAPSKEDIVIKKHTHSLFVGTPAESLLRSRNIEVIILTGYSTEVGIEATARHAGALGFIPVIAQDAIGSSEKEMHDASLLVMRKLYEVKNTNEIIKRIQADV